MNENGLFEQIISFVKEQRWDGVFNRDTDLLKDLRLTGEDATEFIIEFGKKFNVDVSEFDFDKYFYPEGDLILTAILNFISRKEKTGKVKITLGDLEKSIMAKKLV